MKEMDHKKRNKKYSGPLQFLHKKQKETSQFLKFPRLVIAEAFTRQISFKNPPTITCHLLFVLVSCKPCNVISIQYWSSTNVHQNMCGLNRYTGPFVVISKRNFDLMQSHKNVNLNVNFHRVYRKVESQQNLCKQAKVIIYTSNRLPTDT